MAERNEGPADTSPARSTSDNTLEGEHDASNEKQQDEHEPENNAESGEEEKGEDGLPKPVGFFDSRLHKTRIEVAWKWAATSECMPVEQ